MGNAKIGSTAEFIGDRTPAVLPITQKLRTIEREGLDGHELVQTGKRGDPVMWETFADITTPATTKAAYLALSGTLQTITNIDGSTVTLVAVELLGMQFKKCAKMTGGLTGGSGSWICTAQWRLQPTA